MATFPTGTLNTPNQVGSQQAATNNGPQIQGGALMSPYNPVTLPSIPSPVVPPPKQMSVVTPDMATKDLATKKSTTDSVATATQAQTQTKLAQITQPTNPVQPTAGTTQQTQPTQAGTQGTPQTSSATNPNANTTTDILNLLNSGDVKLTAAQVQQIGGLNLQGVTQNPDGTYTVSQSARSQLDTQQGYNPLTSTGDPTTDFVNSQIAKNQQELDQASTTHQQQLSQILNGTFPLTADQQAQVATLGSQFDQLRQAQLQANQNYTNAIGILGVRAGREQYTPGIQASDIQQAMSQGISKLAALDVQASQAVSTLKQGFMDNDFKTINQSYADLQKAIQGKSDTLDKMQKTVTDQVATTTAKIQQQNAALDVQTKQLTSLAPAALQQAMKLDGTLDLNKVQQIADENGVDANALYGALKKEMQTEKLQQEAESKFASDQLQAQATLANTRATTAKTYEDIKKSENTINSAGDTVQSLAQQLVSGQLAPAELSKRTTGTSSYNDVLTAANKLSMAQNGKAFNVSQADRDYKFANNVQTQNTLNYLGSLVGGNGQKGNLDDLESLSNSITRSNFPALNDAAAWARLQTGDPAIAAYYATATEVADQVAKILQGGGTGSGTSDAKLAQATALFQSNFSKAQLSSTINALRPLLQNRAQSIVGDNPYLSDYAEQFGVNQNAAKGKGQSDQAFVESALKTQGKTYDQVVKDVPAGKKGVIDNASGQIGYIDPNEYDPTKYTSL